MKNNSGRNSNCMGGKDYRKHVPATVACCEIITSGFFQQFTEGLFQQFTFSSAFTLYYNGESARFSLVLIKFLIYKIKSFISNNYSLPANFKDVLCKEDTFSSHIQ